jgi:glyoxylase-like metal-dependent hydrolase (beta-lactamase superfamily II)
MAYQVRVIHFGQQGFPGSALYHMRRFGEIINIPFFFWLVQGEGRTLLVDVGASPKQAEKQNREILKAFGKECVWEVPEEKGPLSQLSALGVSPQEVQIVILTHLHPDHSLNLLAFPEARWVMARRAWEAISAPAHPALISPAVYPPEILDLLRRELHKRFRLVEDGGEVVPGIRCFRLGGHSPDLTVVTVETSLGEVIIASDAAIFYDSLALSCPSAGYSLVESLQALDWIKRRGGIVLPGHDWKVLERHPGGVIG